MITGDNHTDDKYPQDLDAIVCEQNYRAATIKLMKEYKKWRPWRGTTSYRIQKIYWLHNNLCNIYDKETALFVHPSVLAGGSSGSSCHVSTSYGDFIILNGRVSVLTYLHEFGHGLKGESEHEACKWSINLFREIFPDNFKRLIGRGHFLYSPTEEAEETNEESSEEVTEEEVTDEESSEEEEMTVEGVEGEDVVIEEVPDPNAKKTDPDPELGE